MKKFTIIWLDRNSSDPHNNFLTKLGAAETFTDVNSCIQYVQTHSNEPIYFIVSGSLAKEAVPKLYECSNIIEIFLFCGSMSAYLEWAMDYCDKLMIFDHGDDLLERLWNDIYTYLHRQDSQYLEYADEYKQKALKYKQRCG